MGCRTVAAIALCNAVAFAQSNQTRPSTQIEHGREFLGLAPPPDPAAAARGQKLFADNCSFCHGATATGGAGPSLLRSTLVLHDEKGELVGPVVQNGRPEKGMPAFPNFTSDQLRDIAAFLHQRVHDAANRWGFQIGNIVTGNVAAGQAFFSRHCTSCHSESGDLLHIAAKYQPVDLQALFLYPRTHISVPVTVTIGEQITGTLISQDDFTIVIKEKSGKISSWQTDRIKLATHDPVSEHLDLLSQYTDADMHNVLAYLVTLK